MVRQTNSSQPLIPRAYLLIILFLFSLFNIQSIFAKDDKHGHDQVSHHDLERGKRLFHGLANTSGGGPINCAACHNVYYIDTLNWNPSALNIAKSTSELDSLTFANRLLNPVTKRLSEVHAGFELTGDEIILIRNYIKKIEKTGEVKRRPNVTKLLLFIFMFLIFGWAVSDLIVIKKVDKKYIHTIVLLVSTIWMAKVMIEEGIKVGRSEEYAPLQPIKFSHYVHATENQIDCQYCHHTAEHSKSAGIPSANLCLNCHSLVREGTHSGRFEIDKIHTAIDSAHPIEWIRIHRLPDFVYFSHAQHVGAGKLDCRECHGPVEDMHVVSQYSDLSMGWCLDCHRTRKVDFIDNEYYGMTFKDYHDKIVKGEIDSVTVADIGGENCMKCHY